MKRILFCTPAPLTKSLGAAKVVVELAEELRLLNWKCDLICPADIAEADDPAPKESFAANLRCYLTAQAGNYDVVDYDHEYLPFRRAEFSPKTLFVARSVLLAQHLDQIILPTGSSLKSRVGGLLKGRARAETRRQRICRAHVTMEEADLINVSSAADRTELVRRGTPESKIIVLPYGISRTRRSLFDRVSSVPPPLPVVAFVGTFDYRKGARDFPEIVRLVSASVPEVQFRLFGTSGLFRTEAEVRSQFPAALRRFLNVMPAYEPDALPALLSACSVGIFPSYMEGMPFGVLEMLAASVPVIAYDAPGAPALLDTQHLVPAGDALLMACKIIKLLGNVDRLAAERKWAKARSQTFTWPSIAEQTAALYEERLSKKCSAA